MSTSRGRVSRTTADEINEIIFKLHALLPNSSPTRNTTRVSSTTKVLEEACNYIRKLQKEVDDLSERISQLVASRDITATDADIIMRLLR